MSNKVLIVTRSFGSTSYKPMALLEANGIEVVRLDAQGSALEWEMMQTLPEVDALIVGLTPVSSAMIASSPKLKVISMHGVGVDHIDLDAARRHNVVVANCPGSNDQAVADLTMGLMTAVARNIPANDRDIRNGVWKRYLGGELWRKKLGLIGFGNIARGVAARARGFEMEVMVSDPYINPAFIAEHGATPCTFDELLPIADYISLHAPLTDETLHIIGKKELETMKPTSYLINTARGGLVDEEALFEAVSSGKIAGAGLDVFVEEPLVSSRLLSLDNIIFTAHTGTHTKESIERMGIMSVENVLHVLQGKDTRNRIA